MVFQKHGSQTMQTAKELRTDSFMVKDCALRNQQYPDDFIECLHRTSRLRREMDLFYTHINILLNMLMPIIMTEKLQVNCPTANLGYLWHC